MTGFGRLLVLAVAILALGPPAGVGAQAADDPAAASAPTLRGDPGRSGVNPGPGPAALPAERWRFAPADGGSYALDEPAVVGDTLYVTGGHRVLHALDAATGAERWRFEAPVFECCFEGTPAVAGDLVFAGSGKVFYALDATSGQARWSVETASTMSGSPVVLDDVVVVVGTEPVGVVYAFDAATGAERWTAAPCPTEATLPCGTLPSLGMEPPAAGGGNVFVVAGSLHERVLTAYDLQTGAERWRLPIGGLDNQMLAVVDGTVYTSITTDLVALDAATGVERWRFGDSSFTARFAVAGGIVYASAGYLGIDLNPAMAALDAGTGAELWRSAIGPGEGADVTTSPTVVGDTVYAIGSDGETYALNALDAASGAERWQLPLPLSYPVSAPVVVGGLIYVGGTPPAGEGGGVLALG